MIDVVLRMFLLFCYLLDLQEVEFSCRNTLPHYSSPAYRLQSLQLRQSLGRLSGLYDDSF